MQPEVLQMKKSADANALPFLNAFPELACTVTLMVWNDPVHGMFCTNPEPLAISLPAR